METSRVCSTRLRILPSLVERLSYLATTSRKEKGVSGFKAEARVADKRAGRACCRIQQWRAFL